MKYNVLFLIDVLQELGGAEKSLLQLASLLNPEKYNSIICCLQGGRICQELKDKKVNVYNFQVKRIYSPNGFIKGIKFINFIRKNDIKIVVTYLESSDFWGGIFAKVAGAKVLISSRRDMGFNLKKRHILTYSFINNLFDKIVTVSEAVKLQIAKKEKTKPDKIVTIYSGVELYKNMGINKAELKKSLGLDLNKQTVTMLANLAPIKGHKDLLTAAAKIIDNNKSVQFLLVGVGNSGYEQELREFVNWLGIKNNVIFTGFRADIPEILSISDISVLSSTSEGFSNAILEYMSAGKPVVATDVGGNRELVVEGETGFLVPARDPSALAGAILKIIKDSCLKEKLGENGRRRVEEFFSREVMVNNIEKLFDNIINSKLSTKEALC